MRDPREKILDYGYFSESGFHPYRDAPRVPKELRHMVRDNPPMPKTTREKQEDYRARMALLGMKEVRGIYLPEALHPVIKEQAAKLLEQHQKESQRG